MKKLLLLPLLLCALLSCEKEHCYPIIQKDYVVYIHNNDTIKSYYENIDVSFQYCGEDVEQWVRSQSYQIITWYECGGNVDGIHYEPLTISITHMNIYLITH